MIWLYRLQQRLALTRSESMAIMTVSAILIAGLLVQQLGGRGRSVDEAMYATEDRRFAEASSMPPIDSLLVSSTPSTKQDMRSTPRKSGGPVELRAVDLNRATAADLEDLPRIGPAMAQRILAHREATGSFQSLQDLLQVRGIGTATLKQIAPFLTVGPESTAPADVETLAQPGDQAHPDDQVTPADQVQPGGEAGRD